MKIDVRTLSLIATGRGLEWRPDFKLLSRIATGRVGGR